LVMVGDSIDSDIKSAEKAGIKGILVDRRNVREHSVKVLSLEEVQKIVEEVK